MINRLEELILTDRIEEALSYVSEMNASHIASLLNYDTMDQAPEKFDIFIRRLYQMAESPYMKADIDYQLSGHYITALCHLENADFAARDLGLDALTTLSRRMIEDIELLRYFVDCPNKVVPPTSRKRFKKYARQLKAMEFQPTVEESRPHEKAIMDWLESIGDDSKAWLNLYRGNQLPQTKSDTDY